MSNLDLSSHSRPICRESPSASFLLKEASGQHTSIPLLLSLTPISRRPIELPQATVNAVLAMPVPAPVPRQRHHRSATIVIVTFNNRVLTKLCLASLLTNTDYSNYELIIIDNASTDGTVDFLRDLARHTPRIRVVCNARNAGFASACNQGLALSTGDLLVLLNNDTLVPPGWLTRLAHHLHDPSIGAVGPVTNRIGNEAQIDASYDTYGDFLKFAESYTDRHRDEIFEIPMLAMFCLAMRRDVYERIGPLDERFQVGMLEDDDYAMRLHAAGYRVVCADDVFVHHFGEASFGNLVPTGEYTKLIEANQQRFHDKWGVRWRPHGRRPNVHYSHMVEKSRRIIETLPPDAAVLVVSRGDDELLKVQSRTARHFPQGADGLYAGHYPADSAAAIAHLEDLRALGAQYLVFPGTALWWLEHYRGFKEHLETRYQVVAPAEECLIFVLEAKGEHPA